MLMACTQPTPLLPDRLPLPPSLLQPCPDLTKLESGSAADILRKLVEVSEQYYECADKHKALAEAVSPPLKE